VEAIISRLLDESEVCFNWEAFGVEQCRGCRWLNKGNRDRIPAGMQPIKTRRHAEIGALRSQESGVRSQDGNVQ